MRHARPTSGYLLVWLTAGLALFGMLGAWHGLMLAATGRTARAFDTWRQGLTEAQRIELAIVEAALNDGETSPEGRTPLETIHRNLQRLNAGGAELTAETAPSSWPWPKQYPEGNAAIVKLAAPTATLMSSVPAELSRWLGGRVEVIAPFTITSSSIRPIQGTSQRTRYDTQVTLITVPLSRFSLAAYEMPEHLGLQTGTNPDFPVRSDMPVGLVPLRDEACCGDWLSKDMTLPYHHRRRASVAAAYRRLFSQATANRFALLAGATHFHDLDQNDSAATAILAGFQKNTDGAIWDLAQAGVGRFGSTERTNPVAVVMTHNAGRKLVLRDTMGNPDATPLLLVLFGPATTQPGYLEVQLETILRPVMIVGYKIQLKANAGAVVRGAAFIDPSSSLVDAGGDWRISHLSYPAASASAGTAHVRPEGNLPTVLEQWIPRVLHATALTQRRNP